MVQIITKCTPVMLSWCSINTQSFVHHKSSSISQFISGRLRNLQNVLRYLSGTVTSAFKAGTGGCGVFGGWVPFGFFGGFGGCSGLLDVFLDYFVIYVNDLPSEALSLITSISSL